MNLTMSPLIAAMPQVACAQSLLCVCCVLCTIVLSIKTRGEEGMQLLMLLIGLSDLLMVDSMIIVYMSQMPSVVGSPQRRTWFYYFFVRYKTKVTFVSNLTSATSSWLTTFILSRQHVVLRSTFIGTEEPTSFVEALTAAVVIFSLSSVFTFFHTYAFVVMEVNGTHIMEPNKNGNFFIIMTMVSIIYQYVIPCIAMTFFLIRITIYLVDAAKPFKNRKVRHPRTNSVSTEGLRVHQGGSDSAFAPNRRRRVPRYLLLFTLNQLVFQLPSVVFMVKVYIFGEFGQIYSGPNGNLHRFLFLLSHSSILVGKTIFHGVYIFSQFNKVRQFVAICQNGSAVKERRLSERRRRNREKFLIARQIDAEYKEWSRTRGVTTKMAVRRAASHGAVVSLNRERFETRAIERLEVPPQHKGSTVSFNAAFIRHRYD